MYRNDSYDFKIESGSIQATDPCYKTNVGCAFKIDNVLNGTWSFEVIEEKYGHIQRLEAFNKEAVLSNSQSDWELIEFGGVDSGQFGFFDFKYFKDHENEREFGCTGFYNSACKQTLHPYDWQPSNENKNFNDINDKYSSWINAGVVEGIGCVSSSGYGDGTYPIYIQKNKNGKVIAVRVEFIDQNDEDFIEDEY